MNLSELYYHKFLSLFIEEYKNELIQDAPGYCMKVTGLPLDQLEQLYTMIGELNPSLKLFVLSETLTGTRYITPSKLIELRNDLNITLLVLIPVNSRTSAEDSYGDATFKELAVLPIENRLLGHLKDLLPKQQRPTVDEVFSYLGNKISRPAALEYLLFLNKSNYSPESIGNGLYLLGLLPDQNISDNIDDVRKRLAFNIESSESLFDFTQALPERISKLPLPADTLQKSIAQFLQQETNCKTKYELSAALQERHPHLNFAHWKLPYNTKPSNLALRVELLASKDIVPNKEDGGLTLYLKDGKKTKIKLRIHTDPIPKEFRELKFFRVVLMNVDGMHPMGDIKKTKVTDGTRSYRDVSFDIQYGQYEEGSYFFHVIAEDEHGTVLNQDDAFRPNAVEDLWTEAKQKQPDLSRTQFQIDHRVLFSSDTDHFFLQLTEEDIDLAETRKAKIDHRLEAYFHYCIEQIRNNKNSDTPEPKRSEWIGSSQLSKVFNIQYNSSHNYQIILSGKLVEMEQTILKNSESAGFLSAKVSANPTAPKLDCTFVPAKGELAFSGSLLAKRTALFEAILDSAPESTGVLATFDFQKHVGLVKDYLHEFQTWAHTLSLSKHPSAKDGLQHIDVVSLSVEMPDGSYSTPKLISPLHPLRLAWMVNLLELFEYWENRSFEEASHQKRWWKNLENYFYGNLVPDVATLVLVDKEYATGYYQYIGELTYCWGVYADPTTHSNDKFVNIHRQIKSYLASVLNVAKEKRIDSDINLTLVHRHLKNYIVQHPYADKLVINIFNPGDAAVFAQAMIELEQTAPSMQYEVRLFAENKLIAPGEALRELINPESLISENAEVFSQAAGNRLFPKLRFSVNDIADFLNDSQGYQAHITFLVNPFSSETALIRANPNKQSFYFNGTIDKPVIEVSKKENEFTWNRYLSDAPLKAPVSSNSNHIVELFTIYQTCISDSLSAARGCSVPAMRLSLGKNDQALLSIVHNVSDWVVTFDKHMGPEFYDLPCMEEGDTPYLLDYIPSNDTGGISSFLTTRPTSEIEGLMVPLFGAFDIDIKEKSKFKNLLEDLRSVGSSLIMQVNSSKNKAFEVVGITLMKRMLQKKSLLDDAFLIPIDLHKNLFDELKDISHERADNLLVDIFPASREIVMTVIEVKCRKSLGQQEKEDLQHKMNSQIVNTIETLCLHFDPHAEVNDRLDRELKTMELQSILTFYLQRSERYGNIHQDSFNAYMAFLSDLYTGYKLRFKRIGIVFDFAAPIRIAKGYLDDTTFYFMGSKVIEEILDNTSDLNTHAAGTVVQDDDFSGFFERSERNLGKLQEPQLLTVGKGNQGKKEVDNTPEKEKKSSVTPPLEKTEPKAEPETAESSGGEETDAKDNLQVGVGTSTQTIPQLAPPYDITIGKTSDSPQYGILGKTLTGGRSIAIDLTEPNTISLFGVQGGGKSYTIGTISEMVLKQFPNINMLPAPLAGVIFHYSESMDYAPEFTSMVHPNDDKAQLKKLKEVYGAEPNSIEDIVLLVPRDKLEERKQEFTSIEVRPIQFNSSELNVQDWMFLLGAAGNDSTYIRQLKAIMKSVRNNISLQTLRDGIANATLLSAAQKNLAEQRLCFAAEYINDDELLKANLRPGRLIIVDLRDELIAKEEALGLFVVMLNIFASVKELSGVPFNKFIVFDEAHKYMNNSELTDNIVSTIRQMRHKGVSLMIASQDPMSLPNSIIELSTIVLLHRFNSPQWVKHVQKSITQLSSLTAPEMAALQPGEAYLWATKSTDKQIMTRPVKVSTRPRVSKHGGDTIKAI